MSETMIQRVTRRIDEALIKMIQAEDNGISAIRHDDSFSRFDVTVDTEEMVCEDTFMSFGFFLFSDMYNRISGSEGANCVVSFFNTEGKFLRSLDSVDFEEENLLN